MNAEGTGYCRSSAQGLKRRAPNVKLNFYWKPEGHFNDYALAAGVTIGIFLFLDS